MSFAGRGDVPGRIHGLRAETDDGPGARRKVDPHKADADVRTFLDPTWQPAVKGLWPPFYASCGRSVIMRMISVRP
jgi:hypothetical protein